MPHQNLIAFDPSVNHIGVAHLVAGRIIEAKTITTKFKGDARYAEISGKVFLELEKWSAPVVIEDSDSWTRKNVKDLFKLVKVVGIIYCAATLTGHEVYLIPTSEWKGTKKKAQTKAELEMMGYDTETLGWDEHARDAAALALWAEGWLRVRRMVE